MAPLDSLDLRDGVCTFRPHGRHTLVGAVDLVSQAIGHCRDAGASMLLVDATGLIDVPMPTLIDRFLMAEEWAQVANGRVVVALVVHPEYIHPHKFGVKVAHKFGLVCDVYASEADAVAWLESVAAKPAADVP